MNSLNLDQKQQYLNDNGYEVYYYTGKLKDAPQRLKHMLRDFVKGGWFVIDNAGRHVYPLTFPEGKPVHQTRVLIEAFTATLFLKLAEAGYVLAHVKSGKIDVADARAKNAPVINLQQYKHLKDGYYTILDGVETNGPFNTYHNAIEETARLEGLLLVLEAEPQPEIVPATHPLIGRYFLSYVDGSPRWQGLVVAGSQKEGFVAQLFSMTDGSKIEQKYVNAQDMREWNFYGSLAEMTEALSVHFSAN